MLDPAGIRIFIVDDHPVVRDGVAQLLSQKGFVVCGEADNCDDALRLIAPAAPRILLIDLSLGEESGLDIITAMREGGMKMLVYSMHCDAFHIRAAFAAGASGYVTKREIASTLMAAIAGTLAGERYVSPLAAQALDNAPPVERVISVDRLSERERGLFRLLGEGYTAAEIADHFSISYSTVQTYYTRIIEKLELTGVRELRRHAINFKK